MLNFSKFLPKQSQTSKLLLLPLSTQPLKIPHAQLPPTYQVSPVILNHTSQNTFQKTSNSPSTMGLYMRVRQFGSYIKRQSFSSAQTNSFSSKKNVEQSMHYNIKSKQKSELNEKLQNTLDSTFTGNSSQQVSDATKPAKKLTKETMTFTFPGAYKLEGYYQKMLGDNFVLYMRKVRRIPVDPSEEEVVSAFYSGAQKKQKKTKFHERNGRIEKIMQNASVYNDAGASQTYKKKHKHAKLHPDKFPSRLQMYVGDDFQMWENSNTSDEEIYRFDDDGELRRERDYEDDDFEPQQYEEEIKLIV